MPHYEVRNGPNAIHQRLRAAHCGQRKPDGEPGATGRHQGCGGAARFADPPGSMRLSRGKCPPAVRQRGIARGHLCRSVLAQGVYRRRPEQECDGRSILLGARGGQQRRQQLLLPALRRENAADRVYFARDGCGGRDREGEAPPAAGHARLLPRRRHGHQGRRSAGPGPLCQIGRPGRDAQRDSVV